MVTAQAVLDVGRNLAGENEAVVGSNNTTVNQYYGWIGAPYCGGFILYCMEMAGCTLLAGCSNPWFVPTIRAFMDAQGWRVPLSAVRPGDVVVEGDDDHVAYICKVLSGGAVIFLEGNGGHVKAALADAETGTGSSYEGIGYRRQVLGGNHRVYHPPYEDNAGAGLEPADVDDIIKQLQGMIGVDQDGNAGPETRAAAATTMLVALLGKYPLKIGSTGIMVYILQGMLYAAGYDPQGFDGKYGADTAAAVRQLQADYSLELDGSAGKDTFTVLLGL